MEVVCGSLAIDDAVTKLFFEIELCCLGGLASCFGNLCTGVVTMRILLLVEFDCGCS